MAVRPGTKRLLPCVLALSLLLASCIFIQRGVASESLEAGRDRVVQSPVKVHLVDGSTVVFADGASVSPAQVSGEGWRYGLTLRDSVPVVRVPLDSVVAMEAFRRTTNGAASFVYSVLGTAVAIGGSIAIYCAVEPKCFGSCPTVYSDSAGVEVLEAEGFSYSIAPLLEARDVDRLRASADAGVVRLEIRNEALETHYINHLELLEVRHDDDELVLPAQSERIVAVRAPRPFRTARDRAGRAVGAVLGEHDGSYFETAPGVLAAARPGSLEDWLDLALPPDIAGDSIVLTFRMRNSLLATVLFYDLMLGDRGARALDWQAFDLQRIATAVELGEWGREHLGMHVSVERGGHFEVVGRVGDTGPVAWKDVAIVVPAPEPGGRVRLSFPADGWRIDRILVTDEWRPVEPRSVPLARVTTSSGPNDAVRVDLARADERYLVTSAGQGFTAEFDVGEVRQARTFLLASQGYYIEWIRREWLATGRETTAFRGTDAALADAMQRWRQVQDSMETRFYATRVPVR